MSTALTILLLIVCVILVFAVLMQPSKSDGGLGGLASGATSEVLGAGRNQFLANVTWVLLGLLAILSLGLGKVTSKHAATETLSETEKSLAAKAAAKTDAAPLSPAAKADAAPLSPAVKTDAAQLSPAAKP